MCGYPSQALHLDQVLLLDRVRVLGADRQDTLEIPEARLRPGLVFVETQPKHSD